MQKDEFRFQDLIDSIRQRKWAVVTITTAFVAAAGVAAVVMPKKYEATIVVAPAESRSIGGGLDSLASQFGGIASIAGLSMGGDSRKSEAIATLQSEVLARAYVEKKNLLPVLFADKWDASAGKWRDQAPDRIPTLWKASQLIDKTIRSVTENPKTGLATVTITWTDPKLAAEWANDLVTATNDHMRGKAVVQIDRNIEFLKQQAAATDIAEVRSAIYSILESEIKNAMLARGTDEYALKVIDPAVPPERHSSPRLSIWVIVALLGGLTVAVLFVLLSGPKPNE
jgi:uncharacterized protein involved in exopolysaccharide biosynthesis